MQYKIGQVIKREQGGHYNIGIITHINFNQIQYTKIHTTGVSDNIKCSFYTSTSSFKTTILAAKLTPAIRTLYMSNNV